MTASQKCRDLIESFEGNRLVAYRCPAGEWTIGRGHTAGVREGMTITPEQSDRMFRDDIANVERELGIVFRNVEWTQSAFDAMVSLGFNLRGGPLAMPRRCPNLTAAVKRGDWTVAKAELLDICHANGKELAGLKQRRAAEAALMEAA